MVDKITELLREAKNYAQGRADEHGGLVCLNDEAEYLISKGVTVLPYSLRDTFWKPCRWRNDVDEHKVSSLTQKADGSWKIRLTNLRRKDVFEVTLDEIGDRVFVDKHQAEIALAEEIENFGKSL